MLTLKTKKEFDNTYKSNKKWHDKHFAIFFKENHNSINKVGFSVSKKIGNAVCRNLVKRRFRHLYRESLPLLKKGDMILLAKAGIAQVSFQALKMDYQKAINRLGILQNV
ncbi:ribonuclease P protein component [Helicobacter burdigaliensis]|uniref:ribonuclease P protein component n=1 Tax=Helicobacter burdigaliensis TaxID=2315334 RepID=UPI000EF70ADE|nr:ribonuclease P protein component [Helicobacter burdigaliensis]